MLPQEHETNNQIQMAMRDGQFTAEEMTRLMELRQRLHTYTEFWEHTSDVRRLEFARWLVQHGKLSEEF
jgi:hypothetical protein